MFQITKPTFFPSKSKLIVYFFTKPCCSLCVPAKYVVKRNAKRLEYEIKEINIEESPFWTEKFGTEIPTIFAKRETNQDINNENIVNNLNLVNDKDLQQLLDSMVEICRYTVDEKKFISKIKELKELI